MKLTAENSNTTTKCWTHYIVHYFHQREQVQTALECVRVKIHPEGENLKSSFVFQCVWANCLSLSLHLSVCLLSVCLLSRCCLWCSFVVCQIKTGWRRDVAVNMLLLTVKNCVWSQFDGGRVWMTDRCLSGEEAAHTWSCVCLSYFNVRQQLQEMLC